MSEEPNNKRRKMNSFHKKPGNRYQKSQKYLEPGIQGFLATCNFREKDCVRECYNLLNEYVDEIVKNADEVVPNQSENEKLITTNDDSEEEDISTQLQKEINTATVAHKNNQHRFQQVETKTPNCIFIKSKIPNPVELGVKIVRDIAETKSQKTRILLRFIPIEVVCKATIEDIKNAAGKLFDKYFLNTEAKTFSIVVNKRYNNSVERMKIIHELADIVAFKNSLHKVDLTAPEVSVVVEIIKGLCCLTVLPEYNELRKYNLFELANTKEKKEEVKKVEEKNKGDVANGTVADADTETKLDSKETGDVAALTSFTENKTNDSIESDVKTVNDMNISKY